MAGVKGLPPWTTSLVAPEPEVKELQCIPVSVYVINHFDLKQLGVCFSLQVIAHHKGEPGKGLKAGTQRQELRQRTWRSAAY